MEPATGFVQIVGLLQAFFSGRALGKIDQKQDFLTWLTANNHEEVRRWLEGHKEALNGIEALLYEDEEILLAKLDGIDKMLVKLASQIDGFSPIARAVKPGAELSDQAISVLRQFIKSGQKKFYEISTSDGTSYSFMDGSKRQIEYEDERLIVDDLATLVELGFLREDYNARGNSIYILRRQAVEYVEMLDSL